MGEGASRARQGRNRKEVNGKWKPSALPAATRSCSVYTQVNGKHAGADEESNNWNFTLLVGLALIQLETLGFLKCSNLNMNA
ncbi:hypothetical protein AV530_009836 [Patagioenas fasciata monilis]|uniref:Uncharacterized protein n=1 Tax=Patagioenas fasciata monilis TaxID=372326 RepID=A0A1V4KAJ7_PATFA|nr:hypothetical protein AV530_009836 [Patagioenas fasciata monilis]